MSFGQNLMLELFLNHFANKSVVVSGRDIIKMPELVCQVRLVFWRRACNLYSLGLRLKHFVNRREK